jgi:hypothetical protein
MGPHVPSLPDPFNAAVHASHRPAHVAPQHTPSAHEPDWHCSLAEHAAPRGLFNSHVPETHDAVWAQSAFVVHVVRQTPATHPKGAQDVEGTPTQAPLPSHVCVFTAPPEQNVGPHAVPAWYTAQPRVPLQAPVCRQLDAP